MRTPDLILKKRRGGELTPEEINYLIAGYVSGSIPDYQMAAFTMAVCFQGMTAPEILNFTLAMKESGKTISWQSIPGIKVDKHSTGGVGDTTTLILAPLVAAAGVPVAKICGRGLGHTGGTLDKLEAIPGFNINLSITDMIRAVGEHGLAVMGQTDHLVPADRKLYALRDVTATMDSLPLIAASIMSKKLAAGADALVLDVKSGDGALLKGREEAFELARILVKIGTEAGRETIAVVTNMDQPLGYAVGNALEVEEAVLTLQGKGPADLEELCLVLGGYMLYLARKVSTGEEGRKRLKQVLDSGAGLGKFRELIASQKGDPAVVDDLGLLAGAERLIPVKASAGGFINRIGAEAVGRAAMSLGAGRRTREAVIDPAAGVVLLHKVGDWVDRGEILAVMHTNIVSGRPEPEAACRMIQEAIELKPEPVVKAPLIHGYIDRQGFHSYP